MPDSITARPNFAGKIALVTAGVAALVAAAAVALLNSSATSAQAQSSAPAAQSPAVPQWQTAAGGRMAFDVASVKLSDGPSMSSNIALDAGEAYRPTGGYFRTDFPLWTYIQFAYKIWPAQDQAQETLAHLPKWATTDHYSIEARGPANASKDQMRLMVQSLLAERFKLAAHFETKELPVFALTLVKAGTPGPKLRPHAKGRACDSANLNTPPPAGVNRGDIAAGPENFPPMCDSLALIRKSGGALMLEGYRNAPMDMLAAALAGIVGHGRPLIDKTGLTGRFDFTLEWAPETSSDPPPGTTAAPPDPLGPTPMQALRDQLGLKLEATKAPVEILIVDHVEIPSKN